MHKQTPLLPGDSEWQQLLHIFKLLGTPNEQVPSPRFLSTLMYEIRHAQIRQIWIALKRVVAYTNASVSAYCEILAQPFLLSLPEPGLRLFCRRCCCFP